MQNSVPFGKYKGRPLDDLLSDQSYLDWIASQPDIIAYLQDKYPELFTLVSGRTDQDSTQHNRLQARFLDNDFWHAFHKVIGSKPLSSDPGAREGQKPREQYQGRWCMEFECGCDVRIWERNSDKVDSIQEWRVEIKPTVGDDYPSILRQMKRHKSNVLLIENFTSGTPFEQVKRIFQYSFIRIRFFSEIEVACEERKRE